MLRSECQSRGGPLTAVPIPTPRGIFTAHFSARGLAGLDFPGARRHCSAPASSVEVPRLQAWIARTEQALCKVLDGKAPRVLPPLDLENGTAFQRRVWAVLQDIPVGRTKSYGEIAAALGSPKAARAVGGACGANPVPLLVPCHRVLAGGGALGGFSGGLGWKKQLLSAEGIRLPQ